MIQQNFRIQKKKTRQMQYPSFPSFQKQKPNPLPLIFSANSTPPICLSLILAVISPPLAS